MVPNIKYYVVTVASIFLALGIGIFMGFMLDAQGLVSSQKEDIVAQLENKFDELKEENKVTKQNMETVKAKNEEINLFLQDAFPLVVRGALSGRTIAIIGVNSDYNYGDLENSLELSGAKVSSVTNIKGNLLEDEETIKAIYSEVKGAELEGELYDMISEELSYSISTGVNSPFIDKMVEQGYINLSGSYGDGSDSVLVSGGSKTSNEQSVKLAEMLIDRVKETGKKVVGIERSDAEVSQIETYKKTRISSVDNVDTAIGKTSLVIVLRGVDGNYGEKETATGLYPDLNNLLEGQGAADGE
jgi:hypothetical protein